MAYRAEPPTATAPLVIARFEDLIALASERRDLSIKSALERDVRLVRFEDGRLELALEPNVPQTLLADLTRKLLQWTGRRWMVALSSEQGRPSIKSQNEARRVELENGVRANPLVQAVLARFPGAEIVAVRGRQADSGAREVPPAPPPDSEDVETPSELVGEDDTSAFGEQGPADDQDHFQ
jgi:DNA polymerase III subunit gamma/tau